MSGFQFWAVVGAAVLGVQCGRLLRDLARAAHFRLLYQGRHRPPPESTSI